MVVIAASAIPFGSFGQNELQVDRTGTILFEVTSPNTERTSYLFGTHHAFGESYFDTLALAKEKLLASRVLVMENLDQATDIINARTTVTPWPKYLSTADLEFVQALFKKDNVQLEHVTPTELNVILNRYHAMSTCKAREVADTSRTLDDAIALIARQHHLKLIGLETAADQLELIRKDVEGMPRKVHARRLKASVQRIRSQRAEGCAEVLQYAQAAFDLKLDAPCTNNLILTDRNARWMERIEPLLEQDCFIAVGLSHLMYSCGLITTLRERGYRVTPVPMR